MHAKSNNDFLPLKVIVLKLDLERERGGVRGSRPHPPLAKVKFLKITSLNYHGKYASKPPGKLK